MKAVGLLEGANSVFHVVRAFFKRFKVPFTARRSKKISTVDVNRRGDLIQWVDHSMNNRCAEWRRIFGV